ncbi:TnsA endonuclease C-terminal domain-containing protein [Leptolyngbya sp. AN02str]|uniref:TnsA endonuclease C-terminal domain-containing protein n=1 Tax=Leptolyngbya sp. AN02str TaxID=3423363 RepID=UPI003D323F19
MPRHPWTQATLDRYIKEGRGQGEGKSYQPWLTVRDVSSRGRSSREAGWKTGRDHHLLSDHERRLFYLFEWSDKVKDIKEQFPLINLESVVKIAEEIGWKYPKDLKSGVPYILTTDFMLTVQQDGKPVSIARTVKTTAELEKKSVAERLEVERRYFLAEGIDWKVVTEKEIPKLLADNVEWIHSAYWLEETNEMSIEDLKSLAKVLKHRLQNNASTINKITAALDKEQNLEMGTSLSLFKHLVARKEVVMDILNTKISSCPSAKEIQRIIY